jgi:hypothetical protein
MTCTVDSVFNARGSRSTPVSHDVCPCAQVSAARYKRWVVIGQGAAARRLVEFDHQVPGFHFQVPRRVVSANRQAFDKLFDAVFSALIISSFYGGQNRTAPPILTYNAWIRYHYDFLPYNVIHSQSARIAKREI